jgi:peptide/nickel transport system substrate-binding protein
MLNMIEPLVDYAPGPILADGSQTLNFTKFTPALAESWSLDEATHTWTFKLRHGVKSCAGNEFTADDVLYSFARAKSRTGQVSIGFFLASVAAIDGFTSDLYPNTPEAIAKRALGSEVKKVDDYTVQIRQSASNALLLPVLTITGLLIYDHVEMQKHATPEDPWSHSYANTVNAPSFGAYCLESWKREQDFVVKANPNYYGKKPYFDRVTVSPSCAAVRRRSSTASTHRN